MGLSNDLISQFVKVTRSGQTQTESTHFGTAVEHNGEMYVMLDGSDSLTPVHTTTDMEPGERVSVLIKNHTATVTGNISSPSARTDTVKQIAGKITEVEVLIADRVTTEQLEAQIARIDTLTSDNIIINDTLTANKAEIDSLIAADVDITGRLTANEADIQNLSATKIDADIVEANYATITNLDATNASIYNLQSTYGDFVVLTTEKFTAVEADIQDLNTSKLSATEADLKYANIDFANIGEAALEKIYATSGIIDNFVMKDGHVTGDLIGVRIKGDLIEANTLVADRLMFQGEDGLYYQLNMTAEGVAAKQTEYNSLNGRIITADSITADKIHVTDLQAFGATIGGFHITDSSLYSGVKNSALNATRGVYLDKNGQFSVGDSANYLRYYKDDDKRYRLDISAASVLLGGGKKNVEETVADVESKVSGIEDQVGGIEDKVDSIQIGARNLIRNSTNLIFDDYVFQGMEGDTAVVGLGTVGVMVLGKELESPFEDDTAVLGSAIIGTMVLGKE